MILRIKNEAAAREILDRVKGRKAPKKNHSKVERGILESDITREIRDFLKLKRIPHYKAWQGLGSQRGVSDIIGALPPSGRALFIEVKKEGNNPTPEQTEFLETMKAAGAKAFVARSSKDVEVELSRP